MNNKTTTESGAPERNGGEKHVHILSTSANLFGICAVLITGLHVTNTHANTLLDETLLVNSLLLFTSCFFSYLSIRNGGQNGRALWYEQWADQLFLFSLFAMFVALALLTAVIL